MKPFRVGFLLFAVLTARVAVAQDICITNTSTFTVKVDLFAGELGKLSAILGYRLLPMFLNFFSLVLAFYRLLLL